VIVLHGIYDKGIITITDPHLPDIKAEVEIILRKKSWQRKGRRVKLNTNVLASEILVKIREE
jgi:hypothetical protein